MPVPYIFSHPIERPNFCFNARWGNEGGPWDQLEFLVSYFDASGNTRTKVFRVGLPDGNTPTICIDAAAYNLNNLTEEELRAHVRMGSWTSGLIPNSKEWQANFVEGDTINFQTSLGAVKCKSVAPVTEQTLNVELQKGSTTPTRTIPLDYSELYIGNYTFDPETQLAILPGSIKLNLGYTHKSSSQLTQAQKDAIVSYVNSLTVRV